MARREKEGGAQPLEIAAVSPAAPQVATEGPYRVVFDGWAYNKEELLRIAGAPSATDDALAILRAYRHLRRDLFPRLKGRFALLIWDGDREQLLCVRDPLGCYPLFYAARDGELVLSTGIGELVEQPGVSDELNRVVIAEHLCRRWPDSQDTHFRAVRRVPPGHVLAVGRGERRLDRYWNPVPAPDSDDWLDEDELERFDEVLDQAVKRCLDMGPAGIYLSGGIDSVSVAAMAVDECRRSGMPLPLGLSLVFPHPECDEEDVQRGVAAQLGIPQVLVQYDEAVGPRGRVLAAADLSRGMPIPLMHLWSPAYRRLAAEGVARGCKVILTGGGGDELLGVSPFRAADLIRRGDLAGLWQLFRSQHRSYPWSAPAMMRSTFWSFGARPLLVRAGRRVLNRVAPSLLRARWRRQIAASTPIWVRPGDPELARELAARAEQLVSKPSLSSNFYHDESREALDHPLVSMGMEELFEEARQIGVPILEPYWDVDLQEFMHRVPPQLLNSGGLTKGLARSMLARRFSELGFERQRKVISINFAGETFATEAPRALEALGGAEALAELGIVDQRLLDEEVARMVSDRRERAKSHVLWDVVTVEAWLRARS